MDLCALERPYDDQSYPRIGAETAAVTLIIARVKTDLYVLTYSQIHEEELRPTPDEAMSVEISKLFKTFGEDAARLVDFTVVEPRGYDLADRGLGIGDAFHLAYAEICHADFITCDDDLLRKCRKQDIDIWYGTPIDFCKKEGLL